MAAESGKPRAEREGGRVVPVEQYRAATEGAALFDVGDRALIEVTGRDRAAFLHSFCTNDIKRLQPGEGCEAFVTSVKGRILGHVLVFAERQSIWIVGDPGTQTALSEHLQKYVITEDVEFRDRTGDDRCALVCGPGVPGVLEEGLGVEIAGVGMCSAARTIVATDILTRRVPYIAGPAVLVRVPQGIFAALQENLANAGAVPAHGDVLEVLRIEAVWPRYGVDITEDHLAQEAGRTVQAISFTKGCYLGQEPIARLDALGHTNRELRGIRFEAPGEVAAGATVLDAAGAGEVGKISSTATNPVTNCAVALAMLKTAANAPGTSVLARTSTGADIRGTVFGPPPIG